ncbi:DUF2326 domain-containing protein [Aquimarina sp. AU58]|uniref:DUF2326 domain-containing protein n=1 Tax=Aquimarina sp. AU58 TaxID=1874112 RepID=UPI000D6DCC89|nr:DUF2326 domain-containing protein [Aquimarina sp. AU58]
MFLKSLTITKGASVIREVNFREGINLIIDETSVEVTGNSVGKTTVLKLIDFCLGANKKNIWIDPENPKETYQLVKDYLIKNEILVTLCLTEDLANDRAEEVIIERNFLSPVKSVIRKIDGIHYTEEEFEPNLEKTFFPDKSVDKPTFRQIISHNIRHKDLSINNTLKTLDKFTSNAEYETLYLFLLGCEFGSGNEKQEILEKIKREQSFKKRLQKVQTKSAYEAKLAIIDTDIELLNHKKSNLNINEDFEKDLNELNDLKYIINKSSSKISKLNLRKELINETVNNVESDSANIDKVQLNQIYSQFTDIVGEIQKSFEDLTDYHNKMIEEKKKFILNELPQLELQISKEQISLQSLLEKENKLTSKISKSDSFEELEILIVNLNEKFRTKGELENIIEQLNEVDLNLKEFNSELEKIDEELFSDEFEEKVKLQINKFNKHFSAISEFLYGEQYALKYEIEENRKKQKLYKFSAFNTNFSSGKKQGEISCFDIAYTLFADEEGIPSFHFLLNDKKELMHNNQLVKIAELVNQNKIQFVASILKDKLPPELDKEEYFVAKLSDKDKLFRIEK